MYCENITVVRLFLYIVSLVSSLLPFYFTFLCYIHYSICYSSKCKHKIANKQKLTIELWNIELSLVCIITLHRIVMSSSQDYIYSIRTSLFFPPCLVPKDSALLTLLIPQLGQYANNPQLAKYFDPPLHSEWGLTIWWLYHIQSRLHPRPPLTSWPTDSSWVQTNPDADSSWTNCLHASQTRFYNSKILSIWIII